MFTKSPVAAAIAVAGLFAFSAPAFAGSADETVRQYRAKPVKMNGTTVYCISEKMSGSYIPKRVCQTKRSWAEAGARVIEKNAQAYASNEQPVHRN